MKEKIRLHKLGNMLMLVMVVSNIFAPTLYNASEVTSEISSSQVSNVEEKEVVNEDPTTSEAASDYIKGEAVSSEKDKVEANVPPVNESTKETNDKVVDLTNMSQDEIVKALDPNAKEQNFITLNSSELKQVKKLNITEVKSDEDYAVVNSTIHVDSEWAISRVNNNYVFCIEPGVETLHEVTSNPKKSIYNSFSKNSKQYIGKVMSSSMQHLHSTGNNDYVFAGQLLIWEYLSDHEKSVLGNPFPGNPEFLNSWTIHNSSEYGSEINTIESDIANWEKRPSFLGNTSAKPEHRTLKYNSSKDDFELTLTDKNKVWDKKFKNWRDFGNYTVTDPRGANNVKITTSVESTSYTAAKKYVWTPYESETAEFYDAGQDLVNVGSPSVAGYIEFNTAKRPLGGFKIKKVDSETGASLKGAEYTLYNSKGAKVKTYTTNASGVIASGKTLVEGKYTLKETKAPVGYVKSNTVHNITITPGRITDLSGIPYKNDIIRGGFALTKLGEIYNLEPQALEGIEFTVTSPTYPKFKKVYITDKKGQIKTSANELKYGNYHIEETKAPSKYVVEFKEDFKISKDGVIVQLNDGDYILNKLYTNKVHGVKVAQSFNNNDDTLYPLSGAKFGIYEDIGYANGSVDRQDMLVDMQTTDENGEFTSVEVPEGSYYVKEIEAPEGYNLNEEVYPFTVANDGTLVTGSEIDLGDIENEVITGTARLTKVGSKLCDKSIIQPGKIKDCQKPLDNVLFGIYSDTNNNGVFDKGEDKSIQVIQTDKKGVATTEPLKYGTYFAKEIKNPHNNYIMNDNVFTFNITNQDEVVQINNGVAIENIEKLGKIVISKTGDSLINSDDTQIAIAGAEYTIYDANDKKVETITTNENGIANSSLLPFGDYTFKETKAPEGYVLDDTVYAFTIREDTYQIPIKFDVTDKVISNEMYVKKTDFATDKEIPGAHLQVLDVDTGEKVEEWTSTTEEHVFPLKYGNYMVIETIAPKGYQKLTQGVKFEVNKDGVVQHLAIENKLKKELVTTGGNNIIYIMIGVLSIVLAALVIVKNNKEVK